MTWIADRVTPQLSFPSGELREEIAAGPRDAASHARWCDALECLREVEVSPSAAPAPATSPARVVAWNVERGRNTDALARVIGPESPSLVLLSEADVGMARSGNVHTARELASALGMGCVYGVEFVELGLGSPGEREPVAGQTNLHGLHGGAILSASPLERPVIVRLESAGAWFSGDRAEPRVGGRIAVMATWRLDGEPVTVVAVHLESHSEIAMRHAQTQSLLEAAERYAPGRAALIAGDLNCFSLGLGDTAASGRLRALLEEDAQRFVHPVPHEPLFDAAREAGFSWENCNAMRVATHRVIDGDTSSRGGMKIDWFLSKGLSCTGAEVLEAVDPESRAPLSDHEPIAVSCGL